VRSSGHFRFVNFGHPPPLVFSAQRNTFAEIDRARMVQFFPLGLEIPEDHPDRKRYVSMHFRQRPADYSDIADIALINPGDILFLYTDGVYDGGDEQDRRNLEELIRDHRSLSAKEICGVVVEYAVSNDRQLRDGDESDRVDDKTVFIIKRSDTQDC
jgi:serine phosphatase RsbU (regulator of sigma subunit)